MITVLHLLNKDGKPYRKTLQYGFSLQAAIDWRMGQVLNGLDPNKRSDRLMEDTICDMYACAFLPPNYPMPAIRLQVEIQSDRVILWRKSRPYWEFQYLASTIPTKLLGRWAE